MLDLNLAKAKGFDFGSATITDKKDILADAALTANAAVPAYMRAYADPRVIEVLTAKRAYRRIAPEVKMGNLATAFSQFHAVEYTGAPTPYGDYDGNGDISVNTGYPVREQYLFQAVLKVGDLEQAMNAEVNLDLFGAKQRAAAVVLDRAFNEYALYGVAGKNVYGLLNDPNLNSAVTPETVGGDTDWDAKTCDEQMDDINKLYKSLVGQAGGYIDRNTALKMLVSPETDADLNKRNTYGISTREMIEKNFPNITIESVPELHNAVSGDTIFLYAEEIDGNPVLEFGYGEKYHAHELIRQLSSVEQKISAGTYGAIIYRPFAVATMVGV